MISSEEETLEGLELAASIPEDVANHPGMISQAERRLLYTLAKRYFSGRGCIVDGGAFLGASTVAFGCGLRANPRASWDGHKPIQSFERAVVEPYFRQHAEAAGLHVPAIGESYEDLLRELIQPVQEMTELHVGDVQSYSGEDLQPVEICFLDILKTEAVGRHCLRTFFPKLAEGALVVHQDYLFSGLPYIKVWMERATPWFEYLGAVGPSAVFRVSRVLDDTAVGFILADIDAEEQLSLHARAEERAVSELRRYYVRISRAMLLATLGQNDDAKRVLKQANRDHRKVAMNKDGTYRRNIAWRIEELYDAMGETPSRKGASWLRRLTARYLG